MHLRLSFRFGVASNEFAVKTSIGSEFINTNLNGVRLWTELGINIVNDVDEIVCRSFLSVHGAVIRLGVGRAIRHGRGSRSPDEVLGLFIRAGARGEQFALRIDLNSHHAFGSREVLSA